jgi:single-strand DNA-binding protein
MASLNRVFLMGNLTRDPELRYLPSGTAVATFTLAVNRVYKLPSGEKKEEVSFIRVVTWARQAETASEYLKKGSPVFVEGRLQSKNWETPDGQKRSSIEVNALNLQFLRGGRATESTVEKRRRAQKNPLKKFRLICQAMQKNHLRPPKRFHSKFLVMKKRG